MKNIGHFKDLINQAAILTGHAEFMESKKRNLKLKKMINSIASGNSEETLFVKYSKHQSSNSTYRMLKSRALNKITSLLFTIDPVKKFKSPYERAFYNANKNLITGKFLIQLNFRKEGIGFIRSSLKTALQFQLTDVSINALVILRKNESLAGKASKFGKYSHLLSGLETIWLAELKSESYYQELTLVTRYYSNVSESDIKKAESYFKELRNMDSKIASHQFKMNMFRTGIRLMEFKQDYKGVISICNLFEKYLESNPKLYQSGRFAEIALYKMDACLSLRNYNDGKVFAKECDKYFNKGTINWLVYLECYFLLCIQTKNIPDALEIYQKVTQHPKYEMYPREKKEKWKLYEAFLNFMMPEEHSRKQFNVFRFLNEVPIFSRDKKGYNFSIVVAQIALLIDFGKFDHLLQRSNSFLAYFRRNINHRNNIRSYYFSKMLAILFRYNFNYEKSKEIADKFLVKLSAEKLNFKTGLESLEIIPYELLWDEILKRLRKNRKLMFQPFTE